MGDAKKNQLKIARARETYRQHLVEMQAAGLLLGVTDPNNLTGFDMSGEAMLVGAVGEGNRMSTLVVVGDDGAETRLDAARSRSAPVAPAAHPDLGAAVPIYQISSIEIEFADGEEALQKLTLVFRLGSAPQVNLLFQVDVILPKEQTRAGLLSFSTPLASNELNTHLNENKLYYSQQIWLSFDPGLLTIHLAPYTIDDKRLIEYIDPTPISAAGNSIVFRWKDEDAADWTQWKTDNVDPANVDVDIVALPTGGVFAEAVLGRFNSAEKLDITRFWNWQDSPIPITAPDIAALQAGQQDTVEQPQAGSIEAPVVTIQNPQPLPDPTSTGSIMSALTAGNLFRDMSGAATTGALAQAALTAAAQGAQSAAGQAGANMATAGQFQLEMTKLLAAAALGIPAAPAPGLKNVSTAGAAINKGAAMDAAAGQAPNPLPLDVSGADGSAGSSDGTGRPASGTVVASRTPPSNEQVAFASTVGGVAGSILGTGAPAPAVGPGQAGQAGQATPAALIAAFVGQGSGTSPWTLDRKVIADRLTTLVQSDPAPPCAANSPPVVTSGPRMLDQANLSLCGVAAFFHIWLKRDPAAVVQYAIDLYEIGAAAIGDLPVVPHAELLQQSHETMWAPAPGDPNVAADLMMMSALRDSENTFLRFRGRESEHAEGITTPDEITRWLKATGLYLDVQNRANGFGTRPIDEVMTLQPDANRDIAVLVHTRMLTGTGIAPEWRQAARPKDLQSLAQMPFPSHYLVLDCPVEELAGDRLRLKFWCWADGTRVPIEIARSTFADAFFGALVAFR